MKFILCTHKKKKTLTAHIDMNNQHIKLNNCDYLQNIQIYRSLNITKHATAGETHAGSGLTLVTVWGVTAAKEKYNYKVKGKEPN